MRTIDSNNGVCARIARRVEASVGAQRYSMWFDRSARFDYFDHQHRLEVRVPNQFVADWIGRNFQQHLLDALQNEVGDKADLKVQIDTHAFDGHLQRRIGAPSAHTTQAAHATHAAQAAQAAHTPTAQRIESDLRAVPITPAASISGLAAPPRVRDHHRHSLEDFVVGKCNELAYTVTRRLASEADDAPSTLFVYGQCAVGKTHLLRGACAYHRQLRNGRAKARYVTAEQFTNEFLAERRAERLDAFRRRVRRLDFFVVDDIGFLANKPGTQREVIAAMDEIESAGGRVLIAAHDHPNRLVGIDDKLISRCLRGMVARIDSPDTATRIQVVRHLAQRRGIPLAEAIANVIASRCRGSIREIEGSLTKLHVLANMSADRANSGSGRANTAAEPFSIEIGHALVERLFATEMETAPRRAIRFDSIVAKVCEHFALSREQVLGHARHRQVVLARSLTCYLAREMTSMSYPEIAAAMGRRTHSTIIASTRRIEKALKDQNTQAVKLPHDDHDLPLAEVVDQLRYQITKS